MDCKLINQYKKILRQEFALKNALNTPYSITNESVFLNSASAVENTVSQIAEFAKSALLPRSYIERYGLSNDKTAYESVGAHTNLVSAIADKALSYYYCPDFGVPGSEWPCTIDEYSYREIMEAIRIHDLPENEIGDWPDNGSTDLKTKAKFEHDYMDYFASKYPLYRGNINKRAVELFYAMNDPNHTTGRLLHLADKTAALIITLQYDSAGHPPLIKANDPALSERDCKEAMMCDWHDDEGHRKASEMWAIDFFHIRKFNELDDIGFFTALIVMYTLMVNKRWYDWREKDYEDILGLSSKLA